MKRNYPSSGFTLVELLVVIAIIGILSAVGLASFTGAQARGRDAARKSDLAQMKRALEMAKNDSPSAAFYPDSIVACGGAWPAGTGAYMKIVPCDPKTGVGYTYTGLVAASGGSGNYSASYTSYTLKAGLENTTDAAAVASQTRCSGGAGAGYYYVCPD